MAQLPEDVIQELAANWAGSLVDCALLGLVAYEYVITFDEEVACVWQRKMSATSVLLLSTRWVMVLYQAIWIKPTSVAGCQRGSIITQLVFLLSLAQIALFSGLRVFALWHDSRLRLPFLLTVLTLGCVPIGTNIFAWSRMRVGYLSQPVPACVYAVNVSEELNTIMLYFTRSSAIAADLLVLILTWMKTFGHWRQQRRAGLHASISTLLLRDGTLYFLVLLALDIAQVLTHRFRTVNGATNIANIFLQGIPPVLAQRFMLNLRQFSAQSNNASLSGATPPSQSAVRFQPPSDFLGNIGEPLNFCEHVTVNDEDDALVTDEPGASATPL